MRTNNKKYKPMTLPSNNDALLKFIEKNKIQMMECVINSIEFAMTKNLPVIELFRFENSEFIITLNSVNFLKNLEQIYKFYVSNENYELCSRIVKLEEKLKKSTESDSKNDKNDKKSE